jgi:thiosulfate/3-mercaptopyruvate sulfurtransferase
MAHPILSDWLVSTDWVAQNLHNAAIRIIEMSAMGNQQAYAEGHIPGALHWPWKESLWHVTNRDFVSPEAFAQLMARSGITHETTVIFYSSSVQFGTYALWVCLMRGHTQVKLLHGSRTLWRQEHRPLVTEVPPISSTQYPTRAPEESHRIGREGVLAGLHNPDRVLLDLRSPEEFYGKRVSPPGGVLDHGAERQGHIPGARHLYFRELLQDDDTFQPLDTLRTAFAQRGALPDKELVLYCRLSHRASLGWFAARYLLGYPRVKVYDGSWTEWGSIVGVPIVKND